MEINLAALHCQQNRAPLKNVNKKQIRENLPGGSSGSVVIAACKALGMVSLPGMPIGQRGNTRGKGHLHTSWLLA